MVTAAITEEEKKNEEIASSINDLVSNAVVAFKAYQNYSQEQVDNICAALVRTATTHANSLA